MAKRNNNNNKFWLGLGLLGLATTVTYLSLTPNQKKKLIAFKDALLGDAEDHLDHASNRIKDVTDSLGKQGEQFVDETGKQFTDFKHGAQDYSEDVIRVIEDKFAEFKELLKKDKE